MQEIEGFRPAAALHGEKTGWIDFFSLAHHTGALFRTPSESTYLRLVDDIARRRAAEAGKTSTWRGSPMSMVVRRAVSVALRAALVAGAATAALPQVAGAAPDAEEVRLEEVTVTASRRAAETALQRTPISVSAVTSSDIDRLVARDISGIATSVPGFSAARVTAFNAASFAMRGVGVTDIIVYQDAPVGVQVDDFVMPSVQTQLLDTFDIERVEVLRGPQGTLFGKNTTGGAVQIQTKRPDMAEFGADVRLGYGSFGTLRAQAAVDIPVVEDVFALRFVGSYVESDGYYRLGGTYGPINSFNTADGSFAPFNIPGITGQTGQGTGERAGGEDVINGRIKAQWNAEREPDVPAAVRDHARSLGRGALVQRHA
jgi:iron complex outermembrane recepter protein